MSDTFLEILGTTSDSFGAAGAPVKLVRAWWRRDEAKNMARVLDRELKRRWDGEAAREHLYRQLARHLQEDELAASFHEAVQGDAAALKRVREYLAGVFVTETDASSAEAADIVVGVIANHLGRAQTDAQGAVDAVGRLGREQADRQFAELRAGQEKIFDAIREGTGAEPQQSGLAQALILGPLRRVGAVDDVRRAEQTADPDLLLDVAMRLDEAGVGIAAESLRERAAGLLTDAGRHAKAVDVLTRVARARIERGTDMAAFTIHALHEVLPEDRQWIAAAMTAMDAWTAPDTERAEILADAAARDDGLWFRARAVDFFALHGQWEGVIDLSEPVVGAELADGDRLAIELDRLWALEERDGATAVEARWTEVLRWVDREGGAQAAGLAWQRRGATLADREDVTGAHDAYRRAMDAWSRVEGFEEQVADAFYSMQASSMINAQYDLPDAELRPLAYALRGGTGSAAARIDQLLAHGMESRLSDRGERSALAAFWRAFALARRSGSLQQTLAAAERLAELYQHVGEPLLAIGLYLAAGKGDAAATLAATADPAAVAKIVDTGGPRYYRAAVYAVLAAVGGRLPVGEAARLGPQVVSEARDDEDGLVAPQPASAAKRALAAIVLTLPDEVQTAALDQLTKLLAHPRYDLAKGAAHALILATNAGVCDVTDELLTLFAKDPYNYGISLQWVAERLAQQPDKAAIVRKVKHDPVQQVLVMAGVADDAECEASAARWATVEPSSESHVDGRHEVSTGMVSFAPAGAVGRRATPETRAALLGHLLDVAADHRHMEQTRASAVGAIFDLAPALDHVQGAGAAKALLPLAQGEYRESRWDENITHPLSMFNITLHTPGVLRAAALRTVARLTEAHDLPSDELQAAVDVAIDRPEPGVVASVFDALASVHALTSPVPIEAALRHPAAEVRIAALAALLDREQSVPPAPVMSALLCDPVPDVRLTLLSGARDFPGGDSVIVALANDPDAYIRALALRE